MYPIWKFENPISKFGYGSPASEGSCASGSSGVESKQLDYKNEQPPPPPPPPPPVDTTATQAMTGYGYGYFPNQNPQQQPYH